MTALIVTTAVAAGAFLVEGRYTHRARVTGYLVPDQAVSRIMAPHSGVVVTSHVFEGRWVRKDEELFALSLDPVTSSGGEPRWPDVQHDGHRTVEHLETEATALAEQIKSMQRKVTELAAVLDRERDNVAAAQRTLMLPETAGRLRKQVAIDHGEHQLELPARAADDARTRQPIVVRAPFDGIITRVRASPGQSIQGATTIADLLPSGTKVHAELFAPAATIGLIEDHQTVRLRYQAFPYQRFGQYAGRVTHVSRTPLHGSDLAVALRSGFHKAAATAEPLYRVVVELERQVIQADGHAQQLTPGLAVDADVILDRRRLIDWIVTPLQSLNGRA